MLTHNGMHTEFQYFPLVGIKKRTFLTVLPFINMFSQVTNNTKGDLEIVSLFPLGTPDSDR